MSTILDDICRLALEMGASYARIINDRTHLEVKQSVRDSCLSNSCGRSGRCWACPPHVGELAELGARLASFPEGVLVQSVVVLEDSWDFEGMTAAAKNHNDLIRQLGKRLRDLYPQYEILVLGCGGCGYCEKCSCPDEPCRFPEEALASVEGYGLEIKVLVESVGLNYINGVNTVSYVGAVFVKAKDEG
jgi:predicted metal-binding protein